MTTKPEAIALAYLDAVAKKDMDRVAGLVDSRVKFTGPSRSIDGIDDLIATFKHVGAVHVKTDVKRVFSDGKDVCVIYDFVTDTIGTMPTIEWLTIEDGKIASADVQRRLQQLAESARKLRMSS